MRTMHQIKASNKNVVAYYENDESLKQSADYYSEGEGQSLTAPTWYGQGAERIGLSGSVEQETFKAVLRGEHHQTEERLRPVPKQGSERYALDFTLSAPKSVSMALHLAGDERIFEAHIKAVQETLDIVEDRYAQVRQQIDGDRFTFNSGNIIAALIHHHTSRDNDLNLHTHSIVMNATQREDGQWRSLFPEGIMHADWVGHYYRHCLAQKVQELGYEIYKTRDAFEIQGISRTDIETFSKRTIEATKRVQDRGEDLTADNIKKAAHATRKAKKTDRILEELQAEWRAEAVEAGITVPSPQTGEMSQPITLNANELITSAIAHHSERLISFRREDLYRYAFDKLHSLSLSDIDQAIDQHPELITHEDGQFTTATALEREIKALELVKSGQAQFEHLGEAKDLMTTLNSGQKGAIEGVLQSTNQFMVWHGKAGVGKTYALGELTKNTPLKIKGFAPTRKAAKELENSLGIETKTIKAHLLARDAPEEAELWIIDEAGLLDAKQGLKLLEKAKQHQARVLFVGDSRQNQSIGAGSFLKSLITHNTESYNLGQILRQENDIQRRAVELISEGQGVDALSLLDEHGYIHEAETKGERATAIASEYLSLSPTERDKTLIVAGTNADRKAIAKALRGGLKEEGKLGDDQDVQVLKDLSFTAEQGRDIDQYQTGDLIRLQRSYRSTRLKRGDLHRVIGKDGGQIILESTGGQINRLDPKLYKEKSVYRLETLPLAVGDRVRFGRNDRVTGLSNGDEMTVAALTETSLTLKGHKGVYTLPLKQPLDLDYGYTITSYRGQGQNTKRVFVSATSDQTSNAEPFYVATSRQRQELKVWSEDKSILYKLVTQSAAQANPLSLMETHHAERLKHRSQNPTTANPTERTQPERQTDSQSDAADLERIYQRADRADSSQAPGLEVIGNPRTIDSFSPKQHSGHDSDSGENRDADHRSESIQRLANAIAQRQIQRAIASPVEQLSIAIEQNKRVLETAQVPIDKLIRKTRIQALANAMVTWREFQQAEKAAQMIALAQGIQSFQDNQAIIQSEALGKLIEHLQDYRAQDAVNIALESIEDQLDNIKPEIPPNSKQAHRSPIEKPQQIPIFWKPNYQGVTCPSSIEPHHWEEFKQSAIHPKLAQLNLRSLEGVSVQVRLLEDKFSGMGSGQFPTKKMRRLLAHYQALANAGGWWGTAGIDPSNDWQASNWGCFKGDQPRVIDGDIVKYEHPLGAERQFYLANLPDELASKILEPHGIEFTQGDRFWQIVHEQNLPITYIEGYKKTLAALSQGEIAIGVSGVNSLYRANEKAKGQKFKLIERLLSKPAQFWATPGREIKFAFDKDTKLKSILNVRRDLVRAIELHPHNHCTVAHWDASQGKGVDDLIVQSGPRAFTKAMNRAIPGAREIKAHYRYQYNRLKKQGLTDPQIWLKACRDNDIKDGDRYIAQSDFVRKNPEQAEAYIKQQKTIVLQSIQQQERQYSVRRGRAR